MVKSKEAWINTKLKEIQKKCKQSEAKDIIDRKYIPYLGKNYAFKIYEKVDIYKCSVYFKNNEIYFSRSRSKLYRYIENVFWWKELVLL